MEIVDPNKPRDYEYVSRGRKPKYPWDKWLQDGTSVIIWEGEDYETDSIQQQIRNRASRMGGNVEVNRVRNGRRKGWAVRFLKFPDDIDLDTPLEVKNGGSDKNS
jgi:hypothetical protein